jgi:hypothetical protein
VIDRAAVDDDAIVQVDVEGVAEGVDQAAARDDAAAGAADVVEDQVSGVDVLQRAGVGQTE